MKWKQDAREYNKYTPNEENSMIATTLINELFVSVRYLLFQKKQ